MKKIIIFLTILVLTINYVEAQQIKRSTLTSVGKLKVNEPFRVSWTAGSCPGCTVLHPNTPANAGYLRQGFQQPSFNGNSLGCPSLTPVFNINTTNSPTCGAKFDLEYTGVLVPGLTVEWDFGSGAIPQTSKDLNPTGIFYITSGIKIISLKVSTGTTCNESRAKTINVVANQVNFSAKATIVNSKCRNDRTGSIILTLIGGTGSKTFRWSNGATTQNITNLAAGRYSVTTSDAAGCTFVLDTAVNQPTSPVSFTTILKQETCKDYADGAIDLMLSGGTPPYAVNWANGSTTTGISTLIAGQYAVTIRDSNLCRIDTSFFIARRCRDTSKFKIYDIITPNGDNLNDKWVVANIEKYPDNELFIYNRWGILVYNTKKYLGNWDGKNQKGEDLITGAYYYVIRLNDPDGTIWGGSITVLR